MHTRFSSTDLILILIAVLGLSATAAVAEGNCTFTLIGTVKASACPPPENDPGPPSLSPPPQCEVGLVVEGSGKRFFTVDCSDPSVADACRWLEPGDPVLMLGLEGPAGKSATHVALLLNGSQPAGEKRGPGGGNMFSPRPLRLGQTLPFGDLRIRFNEVLEDSRCPEDVVCVRAGRVTVAIEVWGAGAVWRGDGYLGIYNLTLGEDPDLAGQEVGGKYIRLEQVFPVPRTDRKLDPAEYSIILRIGEPVDS